MIMGIFLDYVYAFAVGGAFCVVAQILIDKTKLTPARILVAFVVSGVVLGGMGIYKYIADFAGAGASVPLTGFGYALSEGVKKAIDEKGAIGILTGGLSATTAGIATSMVLALLTALIFKSKNK